MNQPHWAVPAAAFEEAFERGCNYFVVNSGAEKDVFPYCGGENRPGMISFTATQWGQLLRENKMPTGVRPLTASECYCFVLSKPRL